MRTLARLKEINEALERRLNLNYPGLGAVVVLFDAARPGTNPERPISVMLHGATDEDAIRLLRKVLDLVDRQKEDDKLIVLPTGPTLIKPS